MEIIEKQMANNIGLRVKSKSIKGKKMQEKSLTEIFKQDPDSYPEGILFQDGLIDYIEDMAWDQKPYKCSEENRSNIEMILKSHPSQREAIEPLVKYEKSKGKGSYRVFLEKKIEINPLIKELSGIDI